MTAKDAGRQARGLAEEIVNSLTTNLPDGITEVTAAGPGFIISSLGGVELRNSARGVRKESRYGSSNRGSGKQVNVEFVMPIQQALFTQGMPEVPATEMQSQIFLSTWVQRS